jgi:hypothetical protein
MIDKTVKIYGDINAVQEYPENITEYDAMATISGMDRLFARDSATYRAKVLKAAAELVAKESGIPQETAKRNGKEVITESPSAYFERITAEEDEADEACEPLVALSAVEAAIRKTVEEIDLASVLVPERVSGNGSIPACSEGIRARLQSVIDAGSFEKNLTALDAVIANTQAMALALGLSFELPAKVVEVLEVADYEDETFIDAYVYAASLASNFGKSATGTNIKRKRSEVA